MDLPSGEEYRDIDRKEATVAEKARRQVRRFKKRVKAIYNGNGWSLHGYSHPTPGEGYLVHGVDTEGPVNRFGEGRPVSIYLTIKNARDLVKHITECERRQGRSDPNAR